MTTVLLDVDGTLVDSMYLHVLTWCQVLAEAGHPRAGNAVQRQVGKDSSLLLEALLGSELADELGDSLTDRRLEVYVSQAEQLRPLPGAVEFVTELVRRDFTVVLASSASPRERDVLLDVLKLPVDVAAITDAEDAGTAKPKPELVNVAMEKVGARPEETVMLGDAVWDVISGGKAGVPVIGVLTGGISAAELRDAGAVAVYTDTAELLADLDGSPIVAAKTRRADSARAHNERLAQEHRRLAATVAATEERVAEVHEQIAKGPSRLKETAERAVAHARGMAEREREAASE